MKTKLTIGFLVVLIIALGAWAISLFNKLDDANDRLNAALAKIKKKSPTKIEKQNTAAVAVITNDIAKAASVLPLTATKIESSIYNDHFMIFVEPSNNDYLELPLGNKQVEVSPPVENLSAGAEWGGRIKVNGNFKAGELYTFTVKAGVKRKADYIFSKADSLLEKDVTLTCRAPEDEPGFNFVSSGTFYPRGREAVKFPYESLGVSNAVVTITRYYDSNMPIYKYDHYFHDGKGDEVAEFKVEISKNPGVAKKGFIDLTEYIKDRGHGYYKVTVEPDAKRKVESYWGDSYYYQTIRSSKTFAFTDLAIQFAKADGFNKRCYAVVTSLSTGKPVANAEICVYLNSNQIAGRGRTDADGLAVVELDPSFPYDKNAFVTGVTAKTDGDYSYLELDSYERSSKVFSASSSSQRNAAALPSAFLFSERDICRPGEDFESALFLRDALTDGAKVLANIPVEIRCIDSEGTLIEKRVITTDGNGFLRTTWEVSPAAKVGTWTVDASVGGKPAGSMRMKIAAFVPDRFATKMQASLVSADSFDTEVIFAGRADYYFGKPVADGEYTFTTKAVRGTRPKHWKGWVVGGGAEKSFGTTKKDYGKLTDGAFEILYPGLAYNSLSADTAFNPVDLLASVSVQEPGGRAVSASSKVTYFPTKWFVGLREAKSDVNNIRKFDLTWLPAIEGNTADYPTGSVVKVKLEREVWDRQLVSVGTSNLRYEWKSSMLHVWDGDFTIGQGETKSFEFSSQRLECSSYKLTVQSEIAGNGGMATVKTEEPFWHWAGEVSERSSSPSRLEFEAGAESYKSGETAVLRFNSVYNGMAYLTAGAVDVDLAKAFTVTQGMNEVSFKIPEKVLTGKYYATMTLIPENPKKTMRLSGVAAFTIDNSAKRKIDVEIELPETACPNEEIEITVKLASREGMPRGGVVKLNAIDEGVAAFTGYGVPDIYKYFFGRDLGLPVSCYDYFNMMYPDLKIMPDGSFGGDMHYALMAAKMDIASDLRNDSSIKQKDTAKFALALAEAGTNGIAKIKVKLPDHLGALRVMAVVSGDEAVGSGEETLIMRDPIGIVSTMPRFALGGDKFKLVATLFNHELNDGEYTLKVTLPDGVRIAKGEPVKKGMLKKGKSEVVSFDLTADDSLLGVKETTISFTLNGVEVTALHDTTFRTANPRQTSSSYYAVSDSVTNLPALKDSYIGDFRTTIEIFPNQAFAVKEALGWLGNYPYGCLEQTTAGAFPFVIAHDLKKLGIINDDQLRNANFKMLMAYANIMQMRVYDGGFAMWPGSGGDSWLYGSLFAWHFIFEAEKIGTITVNRDVRDSGVIYLQSIAQATSSVSRYHRAYAAYVLGVAGADTFVNTARNIIATQNKPDIESFIAAAAMMRFGYAAEGTPHFNKAIEARIWEDGGDIVPAYYYYSSNPRVSGMVLYMASKTGTQDLAKLMPLVNKLNGELRTDGTAWGTTEYNSWASLGLASFAARQETTEAKLKVSFDGKTDTFELKDKTITLAPTGNGEITLEATGTAFVRLNSVGISKKPIARPNPITVKRRYVDGNGNEISKVKKGELITAIITIKTPSRIEDAVIADLIPGGFELEDVSLATRSSLGAYLPQNIVSPITKNSEIRDDRWLWFGTFGKFDDEYTLSYTIRAVSPGK